MNRFFYSLLFYLATPLLILRLLYRALRSPAYLQRWGERFAVYSFAPEQISLVIHAVSVGEVHAAVPLIERLLTANPQLTILVTTSTPTGSKRVQEVLGDRVRHVYLPYDYPGAVQRFLRQFKPVLLVIMETELWPNLIQGCSNHGVKVYLANARLSEKSMASYQKIAGLVAAMLSQLDRVSAQNPQDGQRLQALGLSADKLLIGGNMKYDMALNAGQVQQGRADRAQIGERPVLIAASTRVVDGAVEDEKVLAAFTRLRAAHDQVLLVLVPRHPERFDSVHALASAGGYKVARRSRKGIVSADDDILLGDSMGEMHYYLSLADIAFVGGSLVPTGCQNIIEPAALGLPVLTGPSLFNFQAVSEQLLAAGGMRVVKDANELGLVAGQLFREKGAREEMGKAAMAVVQMNQGATDRTLAVINELLGTVR